MGIRLILTLIVMTQLPVAAGNAAGPPVGARVQDGGGICWVPDVEFPVPCDDDDD
jgi:hypothetical protein